MNSRPTNDNPWSRIDGWLAVHAPRTLAALAPPLDAAGLAAFAQAVGGALPPSLAEAYRAHDGAKGESAAILGAVRTPKQAEWARYMWWLSAKRAVSRWRFMSDLSIDWPQSLLPIAEDAGGNLIVGDLDSGAIATWDHEDGSTIELATDLHVWMTQLADDMDARLIVSGAADDEDSDEITLLAAPLPPEPSAPELGPDRPARVLLAFLLERRFIALAADVEVEPLIKDLNRALRTKAVALRCKRVLTLLTESDAIDELFATDEQLATVLEDFS